MGAEKTTGGEGHAFVRWGACKCLAYATGGSIDSCHADTGNGHCRLPESAAVHRAVAASVDALMKLPAAEREARVRDFERRVAPTATKPGPALGARNTAGGFLEGAPAVMKPRPGPEFQPPDLGFAGLPEHLQPSNLPPATKPGPCPAGHADTKVKRWSDAGLYYPWYVSCNMSGCPWILEDFATPEAAVAAWNRRA